MLFDCSLVNAACQTGTASSRIERISFVYTSKSVSFRSPSLSNLLRIQSFFLAFEQMYSVFLDHLRSLLTMTPKSFVSVWVFNCSPPEKVISGGKSHLRKFEKLIRCVLSLLMVILFCCVKRSASVMKYCNKLFSEGKMCCVLSQYFNFKILKYILLTF